MYDISIKHYMNKKRQRLQRWFNDNAPSLGELYAGALFMIYENHLPGHTRFIAHAVREIANRLPDVIDGQREGGYLDYKSKVDSLDREWKESGLPTDLSLPIKVSEAGRHLNDGEVGIPISLYLKLAELLKEHRDARERPAEKAKRIFKSKGKTRAYRNYKGKEVNLRILVKSWKDIIDWFKQFVHDNGKRDADIDVNRMQENFEIFESFLFGVVGPFFETLEEIDEILGKANP